MDDEFERNGPKSTAADDTPKARRTCMACLVNATYIHELRRQSGQPPAEPPLRWHTAFGYRLHTLLRCRTHESVIFGAVFVWSGTPWKPRPPGRPKAVVALRGTNLSGKSLVADTGANVHVGAQSAEGLSRTAEALDATRTAVRNFGAANVALAGHSLGAAVALHVGRQLAAEGTCVDAYLFNPPRTSLPPDPAAAGRRIVTGLLPLALFGTGLLPVLAAVAVWGGGPLPVSTKGGVSTAALAAWWPNVYVNMVDPISCSYAHYLRSRSDSHDEQSFTESLLHVLPSVKLFVNPGGGASAVAATAVTVGIIVGPLTGVGAAAAAAAFGPHSLSQWWSDDVEPVLEYHALK